MPDKSSATFRSMLAFYDPRVDLDKCIQEEDAKYKRLLTMMASKFSYENEEYICNAVKNHWDVSSILSYYYICTYNLVNISSHRLTWTFFFSSTYYLHTIFITSLWYYYIFFWKFQIMLLVLILWIYCKHMKKKKKTQKQWVHHFFFFKHLLSSIFLSCG